MCGETRAERGGRRAEDPRVQHGRLEVEVGGQEGEEGGRPIREQCEVG